MTIARIPCVVPDVVLSPQTPLSGALRLMLEKGVNHLPVCDGDGRFISVIGTRTILHELIPVGARDERGIADLKFAGDAGRLLTAHLRDLEQRTVAQVAKTTLPVLDKDCPVLEAALLLSQQEAPLPVVDGAGRLYGMLSRRALLTYLVQQAEDGNAR